MNNSSIINNNKNNNLNIINNNKMITLITFTFNKNTFHTQSRGFDHFLLTSRMALYDFNKNKSMFPILLQMLEITDFFLTVLTFLVPEIAANMYGK